MYSLFRLYWTHNSLFSCLLCQFALLPFSVLTTKALHYLGNNCIINKIVTLQEPKANYIDFINLLKQTRKKGFKTFSETQRPERRQGSLAQIHLPAPDLITLTDGGHWELPDLRINAACPSSPRDTEQGSNTCDSMINSSQGGTVQLPLFYN